MNPQNREIVVQSPKESSSRTNSRSSPQSYKTPSTRSSINNKSVHVRDIVRQLSTQVFISADDEVFKENWKEYPSIKKEKQKDFANIPDHTIPGDVFEDIQKYCKNISVPVLSYSVPDEMQKYQNKGIIDLKKSLWAKIITCENLYKIVYETLKKTNLLYYTDQNVEIRKIVCDFFSFISVFFLKEKINRIDDFILLAKYHLFVNKELFRILQYFLIFETYVYIIKENVYDQNMVHKLWENMKYYAGSNNLPDSIMQLLQNIKNVVFEGHKKDKNNILSMMISQFNKKTLDILYDEKNTKKMDERNILRILLDKYKITDKEEIHDIPRMFFMYIQDGYINCTSYFIFTYIFSKYRITKNILTSSKKIGNTTFDTYSPIKNTVHISPSVNSNKAKTPYENKNFWERRRNNAEHIKNRMKQMPTDISNYVIDKNGKITGAILENGKYIAGKYLRKGVTGAFRGIIE